jgi:hypothetical protein
MWNRHDYLVLAAAAVVTFGCTLAVSYPRLANAIDEKPAATTEVKVPTLNLGVAQISAALDAADPQTIIFTVKNVTDAPAKAAFVAQIMETSPMLAISRSAPPPQPATSDLELSADLKPGETQTIRKTLSSFQPVAKRTVEGQVLVQGQVQTITFQAVQTQDNAIVLTNQIQPALEGQLQTIPVQSKLVLLSSRTLILLSKDQPAQKITALRLANPAASVVTVASTKAAS